MSRKKEHLLITGKYLAGFNQFKQTYHQGEESLYATSLSHGQKPNALVVACCDSRADPALLLGCKPGDIFVVRNIANLIPHRDAASPQDSTIAALAYGVEHLKVKHIIVMGHSDCGGIKALCSQNLEQEQEHLAEWLKSAQPVLEATLEQYSHLQRQSKRDLAQIIKHCQFNSVKLSMANLMSWSWIKEKVDREDLHLHPWFFDLKKGDLLGYNKDSDSFKLLEHHEVY